MKKETWKWIVQLLISILTAIATTMGVTSCMANYDGSDLVYGVKKRVGHSNEVLHFIVPMRTKNKRTPFVDVRLRING